MNLKNQRELAKFLLLARPNAEISPSTIALPETENVDFVQKFYDDDKFLYRDRCYGANPFAGEQFVWKQQKLIWGMNYYGQTILADVLSQEVENFLKKVLLQAPRELPLRGPKFLENGRLIYLNDCQGDMMNFLGTEYVTFKGRPIYKCRYHGGSIS